MECRLESAYDLVTVLSALQLREKEKDKTDQRVDCEASERGLKLTAQSVAKDVAVFGWLFKNAFKEYAYTCQRVDAVHLRLPLSPMLSCLQIFSDRAQLLLRCPSDAAEVLQFTLEEEGAVTECRVRTLVLDQAPPPMTTFFAPGEPFSVIRPRRPDTWHNALSEFHDIDAPDVTLLVTLRVVASGPEGRPLAAVSLRARTVTSDAEVELPREAFDEFEVAEGLATDGEVFHRYPMSSVLASCLRCTKDAKAIKVRFNREGVMSTQCILKGRGSQDLFCEALVSPLAEGRGDLGAAPSQPAAAEESMCF